jgi:recombination protein RecA
MASHMAGIRHLLERRSADRGSVFRFASDVAEACRNNHEDGVARALAGLERKFGRGAVQRLGALAGPHADALSTGLIDLDRAIGIGGWPRGRICEIFGPESVGVSTLLLQGLATAQQRGGIVALVDVDHAFVPEYARRLGCSAEQIYIAQPDDGPMALDLVDALVRSGAFD